MERLTCTVLVDLGSHSRKSYCCNNTPSGTNSSEDYYPLQENSVYISECGISSTQTRAVQEEIVCFYLPFIGLSLEEAKKLISNCKLDMKLDDSKPDDLSLILPKSKQSISFRSMLKCVFDEMLTIIKSKCNINKWHILSVV